MANGNDRLAIINADGSFQNPLVALYLQQLIDAALEGFEPDPGEGGTPLTSYVTQIQTLLDYPTDFPPSEHSHPASAISDATTTGRSLLLATTPGDAKVILALGNVLNVAQLPLVNGIVCIAATALNTFPSRAANIPAGWTGPVTWLHTEFGTCTVGPADAEEYDTLRDTAP